MKYMGSKNRHAKELIPIITKARQIGQYYIEPFAGGFNMIDKVDGLRIASDIHKPLIDLFVAIRDGWEPPSFVSEEEYKNIRNNPENYPNHLVGFVGFGCSYGGKWFGGYARGKDHKGIERNYCLESKNNILKQKEGIQGIDIRCGIYDELNIPPESIIYCDPPYAGTTKYKDSFDSLKFWQWCRNMKTKGHTVFVSEYNAPEDFVCIWQKEVRNTLVKDTGSKSGIERLFTI